MRRSMLALSIVAAASAVLPATQAAAAQPRNASVIDLVAPMRVTVGKTLTVRGRNFSPTRVKNTLIFRAPNKRVAFAKPSRATRRKLVVEVPGSVERLLTNTDNKGVGNPTRFTLRVVVKRRYGRSSARRNSPVVVSALRSGEAVSCGTGADFDRDLLTNSLEGSIKTDPCKADTDDDGVEDGFEYYSALDLNQKAVPAPGKRPFSNALDPTDAAYDYDGDGLSNRDEFRAWARASATPLPSSLQAYTDAPDAPAFGGPYGTRPTFGNHALPLNYSDGDQTTVDVRPGHPEYRAYLDFRSPGVLTDDERDVDGDGLRNIDEIHPSGAGDTDFALLMLETHYEGLPAPCTADEQGAFEYKPVRERPFLEPDYLDWDSDGDGVWDGNDDQDSDGVSNVDEIKPPHGACGDGADAVSPLPFGGARNGATVAWDGGTMRRSPYNPCLPYRSSFCAFYEPR